MKIFQLGVKGASCLGWRYKRMSKEVFRSREAALARAAEFIEKCKDESQLDYLVDDEQMPPKITVFELELEG